MKHCTECKKQVEEHVTGYFCSRECSKAYHKRHRSVNRDKKNAYMREYCRRPGYVRVVHHKSKHVQVQGYLKDVCDPPGCQKCGNQVPIRSFGSRWASWCSEKCRLGYGKGDEARCKHCWQAFVKQKRDQVYCSDACRGRAAYERRFYKDWEPSSLSVCIWCGFEFLGEGEFCGVHCRTRAREVFLGLLESLARIRADRRALDLWKARNSLCQRCGQPSLGKLYCGKRCSKAAWRKGWRQRNPIKRREQRKALKARRRQRKRGVGNQPTIAYRRRLTRPGTRQVCFYCGTDTTGNHHWDHWIPLAKGGPEAPWNLVVSCPTCNHRKHDKLPESRFCEEILKT